MVVYLLLLFVRFFSIKWETYKGLGYKLLIKFSYDAKKFDKTRGELLKVVDILWRVLIEVNVTCLQFYPLEMHF
jgi:hypothetical protein